MIPSFIIHFNKILPYFKEEGKRPKNVSQYVAYATSHTWHDEESWCNIQFFNGKHIYLYSIEIETTKKLHIPVEIILPDTHWQFAMKGGYGLPTAKGTTPILAQGQKHLIRGTNNKFDVEISEGTHWLVGFNIAGSWLGRYPDELPLDDYYMAHEVGHNMLYQSEPLPINDFDLAEIYYMLGLAPSKHILQDSQVYLPVTKLVDHIHSNEKSRLTPLETKVAAIEHYIRQCIQNDQYVPAISTIAAQFGIDKDYLGRLYHSLRGTSLNSYINTLKQERAVELLFLKKTTTKIAYILGYSDVSSFSRAFKAMYGVSPSQYLASLKR